jgi:hypothetical protein
LKGSTEQNSLLLKRKELVYKIACVV